MRWIPAACVVAAAASVLAAGPQTGTDGVHVSLGLGYPQTLTLGAGYRSGPFSLGVDYQPPVDRTFLASSLDLAGRAYFAPVDATSLFKANGQFYVGLVAGRYDFEQDHQAGASDPAGHGGTLTRTTTVTGPFVAPHLGFQLYDGQGHQLETELGWFKPLGRTTGDRSACQGAPVLCDQAASSLPDQPPPAYLRTSGWHVTLVRYVWTF